MGRKRRSGLSEGASPGAGPAAALSLAECLCPVCQELLAEPVTPPCGHSLCLGCFQQTVAISNLNCPLCRRRLSNWARGKARDGTLVNAELQERIQQQYPRLQAEENNHREVDRLCSRPQLCKPGEVRKEYEEQISKLRAERHARDEEEQRASEDLIQKILAEEKERLIYEEKQRKEVGEQLKRDEELAQMLSKEVNSTHKTHPESVTILSRRTSLKSNSSSVTKGNRLIPHSPSSTGNIQNATNQPHRNVAQHFNFPSHSAEGMQVLGLLHCRSLTTRRLEEERLIFRLGILQPQGINVDSTSFLISPSLTPAPAFQLSTVPHDLSYLPIFLSTYPLHPPL